MEHVSLADRNHASSLTDVRLEKRHTFRKCFSLRLTVHILSLIIASDSRFLSFNGGKLLKYK